MRAWVVFGFLALFFGACQTGGEFKIIIPEPTESFFQKTIKEIDSQLADDPQNATLHRKKLYPCEYAGWPSSCLRSLKAASSKGMSRQLAEQYIAYYRQQGQFDEITAFIRKWDPYFFLYKDHKGSYIRGLLQTKSTKEAYLHLRQWLHRSKDAETLAFASQAYMQMGDTVLCTYALTLLHEEAPLHDLMYDYVLLLISQRQLQKAYGILQGEWIARKLSIQNALSLAFVFEQNGWKDEAIEILTPHQAQDTAIFYLSSLHISSGRLRQGVALLDAILNEDPTDRQALWKKAMAYENRGWLTAANSSFEALVEAHPEDSAAQKHLLQNQRKIAYLQRQKRREAMPPLLELKSLKPIN